MSRFILQALTNQPITVYGNGTQTRSFCYVTDTIAALILLTADVKAKGEVVNVGNDQEITILELAKKIKRLTKSKSEIEFHPSPNDDPKRRRPDTSRLQKLTGWRPEITLKKGLERTATWLSRILER
jgi:nucleoside-diphosphate-sugar epimerase